MKWWIHTMDYGSRGPYPTLKAARSAIGLPLRREGKGRYIATNRGENHQYSFYVQTREESVKDGWIEEKTK